MRTLFFDQLESTNDFLKEQLNVFSPAPFLGVLTDRQTKGRGRLNRTWLSEKGSSFLYSLLLPGEKKPFHLGFVAAVSAIEVLNKNYGIEASMKWPNDIYRKNKKMGGILLEKEKEFLILGIGINLNQQIFSDDIREKAVSLFQISGIQVSPRMFLFYFEKSFLKNYQKWKENPYFYMSQILPPYLCWVNQKVVLEYAGQIEKKGIFKGIDPDGFLLLENNQLIEKIPSGDLKLCLSQ